MSPLGLDDHLVPSAAEHRGSAGAFGDRAGFVVGVHSDQPDQSPDRVTVRLTLVSDDNFSMLQRTILLQFTLPGKAISQR